MALDPLPRQRLAIEAPPGPVLVIAGPGAGKTFCLIARINHLVGTLGVAPERICAVTFTNRAAEEIALRLKHTLRDRGDAITRGTIHALCLALLREHAEAAGLRPGFGVADEQYQKVILGRLHVPLEQRGALLNRFSRHRAQDYRLTPEDARLYREYAVWLAHRNMLDFDDLVAKAEQLLRTRSDIADTIAARWDHLLVDEFQDVNAVQYDLLRRLAAPHDNLFAVGDDEQSIFAWAGADPYVLVRFGRDYGIERPIILDKNRRCSRQIFETARRVLAQNPQLFEKQLSAEQESPYEVGAFAFRDEAEEAAWLLEDLRSDRAASGLGWGAYAVLYRRHKLGEYLEGRLLRAGIPCRLADFADRPACPEALLLAARHDGAMGAEQRIVIEPQGGLEIARRGRLIAAGVRNVPAQVSGPLKPRGTAPGLTHPGETLVKGDGGEHGLALTLFKALQLLHAKDLETVLERYVTFDFETTDNDVTTCGVVEIGAARVVKGEIVDRFHTLVQPYQPISSRASAIHGYTDHDVRDAPSFAQVWPQFRAVVGDDVLIAHNRQHLDIPVLRRLAAGLAGMDSLAFYDTLPLARSLSRHSAQLEDLALRFGIDACRAHHAWDDAITLARVYRELERRRGIRARKAVVVHLLDYLGLALVLEQGAASAERDLLLKLAKFHTLGRYSDALEFYQMERERTGTTAPSVDEVIERLGGRAPMTRPRAEPDPGQRYPAAVARLRALIEGDGSATLSDSIDRLLERVALSTSEGVEVAPDRVNLLTLHSTKGLEFSRVYIVGVEDYQIPGYRESTEKRQAEIEEARRLLYVGMTRARERLVLTRVERRSGMEAGGSTFLEEMGLEVQAATAG